MTRNPVILFIFMLFCHVLDDYVLQGILANLKQKSYWKEKAPDKMYRFDYIMALFMHSASWSFMITLPLLFLFHFNPPAFEYIVLYIINIAVHMITDDLKANKHKINLIQDQIAHICQIVWTLCVLVLL